MSESDKTPALIMVCIVLLSLFPVAGYLTIVVLLSRYIRRNKFGELLNVIKKDPGLIFLMSSFALSALFTKQHFASLAGIIVLALQVSLYVIIRKDVRDREGNFKLIRYLLIASFFVSTFGIFQYNFFSHMPVNWVDKDLYAISNRAFSTLYNPNVLGSYLIIIISVTLAGFRCSDGRYHLLTTSLVLIAAILCMYLTLSRGAWLGLAVSIFIIFVFSKHKRYIVAILAFAILTMLALETLLEIPLISRMNLDVLKQDSSIAYRWPLWKFAFKTFTENPLFGSGIGSFGFYVPSHFKASGYLVSHAHNIYLQLLAETGLLGFVAFMGYLMTSMYISFQLFRRSSDHQTRCLSVGVWASCGGLLAHGVVDATLYLPQLSIFMWVLIAVIRNIGDLEFVQTYHKKNPVHLSQSSIRF